MHTLTLKFTLILTYIAFCGAREDVKRLSLGGTLFWFDNIRKWEYFPVFF